MTVKRVALFFLAIVGLVGWWPSPAFAHNSLVEAAPAKEAKLDKPPAEVRLLFLASLAKNTKLTVADAAGANAIGATTIDGKVISAPFTATAAGTYTVTYELVSADGHPAKNSYTFSVAAPPAPPAPVSQKETSSAPVPAAAAPRQEDKPTPWFPYIGGAALAGLAVGGLLAYLKRKRHP